MIKPSDSLGSPFLISISLKGADVVLVESVIRAAREAAR